MTAKAENDNAPTAEARMEFLLGLRKRGVRDTRVLRALEQVPRERFVGEDQQVLAFADRALPIECGQTISQPYVVAAMTEALDVRSQNKVLEIGTGSGYQAAILAHLAKLVISVERYRTLADQARARLASLGLANVTVLVGDGTEGARDYGPFERIMVTAAASKIPEALVAQLTPGGILIAPIGPQDGVQNLTRFEKKPDGGLAGHELMAVRFVPLVAGKAATL
jgi:protein-L-isoaspartate(D-aspartate) O-methyltransferase